MSSWTPQDIEQALDAFNKRASTDAEFRQLALNDTPAAVRIITGRALPDGFRIRAVPRNGADMVIVVPELAKADGELSDVELEQVSGGRCPGSCAASGACAVSSTVSLFLPGVGGACV